MKRLISFIFLIMCFSNASYAGGYSVWAVPTQVEIVGGGVLIWGAFGDPNECGRADTIFISETDSRYEGVLSMSLAALMDKREMKIYSSACTSVLFHWGDDGQVNHNKGSMAVYVR